MHPTTHAALPRLAPPQHSGQLPQPSPYAASGEIRWMELCGLRAQTLRQAADRAGPHQEERAATQYGAAAAYERAATAWAAGDDALGMRWMDAADNTLRAALLPVPWGRTP